MRPEDHTEHESSGATKRPRQRFAFSPRVAENSDTADSVSRDSRLRRNRQIILAVLIAAILAVSARLVNFESGDETTVQISAREASVDQGGTVSLEGLSYRGVTNTGKNFIVLADLASESTEQPDLVTMVSPRARVETAEGDPITIRSNTGELMRKTNTVNLTGKVVIFRPDIGYTLMTEEASANLGSGKLVSEVPIQGFSPDGSIQSSGMVIGGDDESIRFTGKSRLVINRATRPAN